MIDVSMVLLNPDICESFTAQRSSGQFGDDGRFASQTTDIPLYGSVQKPDANTLQQVDEGDRVTGARAFYSISPMYETRAGDNAGLSDLLVHRGQKYRVAKVWDWSNFGYWHAYAVRLSGA
ncbi:MAG TPA: hypothetical protein VGM02_01515 [Acidobacteriaceae bacterium]|jgi:hypothetical protein